MKREELSLIGITGRRDFSFTFLSVFSKQFRFERPEVIMTAKFFMMWRESEKNSWIARFSVGLVQIECFTILIQLPLNKQKYSFVSLLGSALNLLLCSVICFISLRASTGELWLNQSGKVHQVGL